MDFNKKIWDYIINHTSQEDPILAELNRETYAKMLYPRMLSGHYQGKLLEFISKMIQPEYILEIGTFTGYSAICLAKGLKPEGKLYTIECNDEIIDFTRKYIVKSGFANRIEICVGDALQIIPQLNVHFDLIFIDADKTHYPDYFRLVVDKLKTGGVILADNALWDGKVVKNTMNNDDETNSIRKFNKMVNEDKRFENMILPVRDGVMFARKING